MRALYDLGRYLASFNHFEWLLQVEACGATVVVFDIRNMREDKWPLEVTKRRFESICLPGPALIGLPHEVFGPETKEPTRARPLALPGGRPLVEFWKSGRRFKRLKSVLPPKGVRYTVTLRKTQRSPLRDSDESVWLPFAKEIGALVIPDYDVQPIHLHERMALYAGAQMNFFVSNGPGVLCSFSEYPCMMFNTQDALGSLIEDGIGAGEQYPWMLTNQRAIWEAATAESLRRNFYHWRDTGRFSDDRYAPPAPA
jgi:hypothetical protein